MKISKIFCICAVLLVFTIAVASAIEISNLRVINKTGPNTFVATDGKEYNFKVEDGQTLIEMNGNYYRYPITNAALDSTIRLVADIAKRNNLGELYPNYLTQWPANGLIPVSSPGLPHSDTHIFDMFETNGVLYRRRERDRGFIRTSKATITSSYRVLVVSTTFGFFICPACYTRLYCTAICPARPFFSLCVIFASVNHIACCTSSSTPLNAYAIINYSYIDCWLSKIH